MRSFRRVSIIYLLRDIRDIVASMKKLSHIPMVENQLRRMKSAPDIASRFAREIALLEDPDVAGHIKMATVARAKMSLVDLFEKEGLDVLRLRYEDLVKDPEGACRLMTEHAGMSPSELCLSPRHDLWGMGPRLYRAIATGRPAFDGWLDDAPVSRRRTGRLGRGRRFHVVPWV